ncbi:MAG: hypothetical protein ABJN42_13800 [Roseibium sp.]|uniref:hypothetical protein n=1 Tax=Roseibium sp. TaxID=1936156 RepID=UPI003297BBE6
MALMNFKILTDDDRQEMMIHALEKICPEYDDMTAWHFITGQPGIMELLRDEGIDNPIEVVELMTMRASIETIMKATLCSSDLMKASHDLGTAVQTGVQSAGLLMREREDGIRIFAVNDPDMPHTQAGVIAVSPDDDICGVYLESNLVVDEGYRGRGLATDLIIDCTMFMGGLPGWSSPEPLFSEAGLAAHLRAWDRIERNFDLSPLYEEESILEL